MARGRTKFVVDVDDTIWVSLARLAIVVLVLLLAFLFGCLFVLVGI